MLKIFWLSVGFLFLPVSIIDMIRGFLKGKSPRFPVLATALRCILFLLIMSVVLLTSYRTEIKGENMAEVALLQLSIYVGLIYSIFIRLMMVAKPNP